MSRTLHLFDLDRTFVRKNLSYNFYFFLLRQRIVSPATLVPTVLLRIRHLLGLVGLQEIHHLGFQALLKGLPIQTLESAAEKFAASFAKKWVCPEMLNEFCLAKKRGETVCLLSSSACFLVKKVSNAFGFDQFGSTEYVVNKEGRLEGIASLVTGPEKLAIAKTWAEKDDYVYVYSDSFDDLPLLEWADKPIAVRPDRSLLWAAHKRKWTIIR